MTTADDHDSYPREWLNEPPHPADPRLGDDLEPWEPSAAQRALVLDLLDRYVRRDPSFAVTFLRFGAQSYGDKTWPQMFLALLEYFAQTAIGAQAEALTIARVATDLRAARDDVIEFGELS